MIQGKEDKIAVVVGTITEDPRLIGQFELIRWLELLIVVISSAFRAFFSCHFVSIHRIAQAESAR